MFDATPPFDPVSGSGLLAALSAYRPVQFVPDRRFIHATEPDALPSASRASDDRWQAGYDQGLADAREAAAMERDVTAAATDLLARSLTRLDEQQAAHLADRLRDTVVALCDTIIEEAAIDEAALTRRIALALAMLRRAEDDRILRIHPDDAGLIAKWVPDDLTIVPDPAIERGTIRVEMSVGGVETGPRQWREAIASAVRGC